MRLSIRGTLTRKTAAFRSRRRRRFQFESLETRQMLNAAPVANDDTFTVAEDGVLSTVGTLPPNVNPIRWIDNGHYYAHVPGLTNSWRNAETAAANMRYLGSPGHLVSLTSAAEEAFVLSSVINQLPQNSRVFAGLTDRDVEGTWKWVTGEAMTYTHWNPGEPTPNVTDEDYMAMYFFTSGWVWTDFPDNGNFTATYIVEFDGPFNNGVLASDTDADNNPLTATVVTGPQHGTLALSANGTFSYTPNANYVGPDSFTYTASDGQVNSNVATVTINVTPVNDPPTAAPDQYVTAENQPLGVPAAQGVLANDSDLEGDQLTAVLAIAPTKGQLTLNSDGSFTYTPATDYYGHDSFTYRASDGVLQSDPVTVALLVTSPRNVAPVAQDDTLVVTEDGTTKVQTVSLPAGDLVYDPANDRLFVSVLGSGGALANTITPLNPQTGALGTSLAVGADPRATVVSSDGRYIHTVIEDGRAIQIVDLAAQTLGPKINLPGNEPYAERVRQIYAISGQPDTVLITRYYRGQDPPAAGTFVYKSGVQLADHAGGGLGTGGPDITAVDDTGTLAFGYESAISRHPFYVMAVGPTGVRVTQTLNSFLTGGLDVIRYSRDRIFTNTGLVRRISTNSNVGSFVATPNFVIDETLNRLFAVTVSGTTQTVHIYDLDSLNELDTITLSGRPAIQGSLVRFGDNGLAFRGEGDRVVLVQSDKIPGSLRRAVLRNDSDAENAPLTAALVDGVDHGSLTFNADGTFIYTPESNFNGTDSFTYRASDGQLQSNVATVTITVASVNDPPVALADGYSVAEDNVLIVGVPQGVLANDTDVEGDPLSAAVATGPTNGQLTLNANGSFTYTPNPNFHGTDTFTYRANDADPSQPGTVTIQVTSVNDAPVAGNDTVNVTEDTPFTFTGTDLPAGVTPFQWSVNGHNYAIVMGNITWPAAKAAAESLRLRGSRGHLVTFASAAEHQLILDKLVTGQQLRFWIGLTDEGTEGNFRWVTGEPVTFTNWAPGQPANSGGQEHYVEMVNLTGTAWPWNDINATRIDPGYIVEFDGPFRQGVLETDQDVDNDTLTAQLVSRPSNGTLTLNANGTFTYTPNANFTGTDSFTYKASDGQAESNVATVTLNVAAANDPPVAVADSYFVATTLTVNAAQGVLANDTDIDSPAASLRAQLVTPPQHGTLTFNADGSFTYMRGLTFTGSDTFTYRTSDGSATSAPTTVTITAALRLTTENVTIVSNPLAPVEGFFDVFVEVAPGFDFDVAGYDVALRAPAGSGVTLVSALPSSTSHPSLFASTPTFTASQSLLRVTDALETGAAQLDNGDGLFRVRFTVAPDAVASVPILFTTAFTNLSDENGESLPIDRAGGVLTITELPAPKVAEVLVRGSEWSPAFRDHVQLQGLGYSVPSGEAQLADLPWTNLDQIVVRFNEHVSVQQNDLALNGVNTASYAISSFAYNPATFTATWTLAAPLAADKLRLVLNADGADPIRNAAGVRLDGDWSDGASAFPSGGGRSGGNFAFRLDVLPGNVDRAGPTNVLDTIKTRNRQFTAIGDPNYAALYDVNGSGQINITDTIQVRNSQFTSLPDNEPATGVPPAPLAAPPPGISAAPGDIRLRTENVTIISHRSQPVEGFFDVFVEVASGVDAAVAGYDVALRTPAGSGVTLVWAGAPSSTHPSLFASEPIYATAQGGLNVTDALPTGATHLDNGDGLFRVRFTGAPGIAGNVPLQFNAAFTNLADANGDPLPIERAPGEIALAITGTSGNDTYHVLRAGSKLHIYENTPPVGQPTYSSELAAMTGTLTINAGDGNDSLTVNAGGQASLGLAQFNYSAGSGANSLVVEQGSARIESTANGGTLNSTVQAGAQLTTSRLNQNGLTVSGNGRVNVLPGGQINVLTTLDLSPTGTLDLADNDLVIQSTAAAKPAELARAYDRVKSGLAGGGWIGAGIHSSAAATNPNADTGLSVVDNALLGLTEFGGVTVDENSILLKYTYYGDIDVNGQVDADDLTVFANNFGRATGASQIDGDIDFDGDVDADDLTVFANNFGRGIGAPLAAEEKYEEQSTKDGVVARSPDRATSSTAGLPAFDATMETSGPAVVRDQETRAQQVYEGQGTKYEEQSTKDEARPASADDALLDLLAEAIAAESTNMSAITSHGDGVADPRLATSRKASADALAVTSDAMRW